VTLIDTIDNSVTALAGDATAMLQELITIPSVTGNEAAAQGFVAGVLGDLAFSVDMWKPTRAELSDHRSFSDDGLPLGDRPVVVGRWGGTTDGGSVILNGHIDVVPTGREADFPHGPWSGEVHDNIVWGRGSCDMKGGLVAGIIAVAALQRAGLRPAAEVILESVIGEETGGVGTLATVVRGYRADAAVVLEPTRLQMCPVGCGACSFRLRVPGLAAHGAMRQSGVSALDKLWPLHQALARFEEERHTDFSHPLFTGDRLAAPLSIGTVAAGDWPSTVPDALVAEGRYGIFPGEDLETARAAFEQVVLSAALTDPWLAEHPPTVEWFEGQFESAETSVDDALLTQLNAAHTEVTGSPTSTHGVTYGSDLRFFTNDAGMPAVLYGPGDVADAHTVNEHVLLDEVLDAARTVALLLMKWRRP
jgi:acetylornithine deacetylase